MACRRCFSALARHSSSLLYSNPHSLSLQPLKSLASQLSSLQRVPHFLNPHFEPQSTPHRGFSSGAKDPKPPKIADDAEEEEDDDEDEEEDETSDDEGEGEIDANEARGSVDGSSGLVSRAYFVEDKIEEAANIGYKVIGPLEPSDRPFKPYEPVFAIVQIGSHQFKVSNRDCIYVEKLKYCEVNDKMILNKVLMVGSPTQTIIGRPILPEAAVHAVVEEHALDAKVIIFKKKRRKNYRRTNGHRQELTRLRITDIQGIEKPEPPSSPKKVKTTRKKPEKELVAA